MVFDKNLAKRMKDYRITELSDNIYAIDEFGLSRVFLVVGNTRALLIDCGTGVGNLKAVIEKLTPLPYDVVATHCHIDHVGGMGEFSTIHISKEDAPLLDTINTKERRAYNFRMKLIGMQGVKRNKIKDYDNLPDIRFIKDSDIFDLGGKVVRTIATPGHTLGSLSFLVENDGILFSGDIINPLYMMFLSHSATFEDVYYSYNKLLSFDITTIYPTHLTYPLAKRDIQTAIFGVQKILKRKNGHGSLTLSYHKGFLFIYRNSLIHKNF